MNNNNTILSQQELDVLRSQGLILPTEVAFRDPEGNLIAENVMTRDTRKIETSLMRESKSSKQLLLG